MKKMWISALLAAAMMTAAGAADTPSAWAQKSCTSWALVQRAALGFTLKPQARSHCRNCHCVETESGASSATA